MSADLAHAGRGAPRFRYFLPHSPVARRMVLLSIPVWVAFRIAAWVVSQLVGGALGAVPGDTPEVGVQAMAWIVVTAIVTGAVMIQARLRGDTLFLANLGSPPAATAGWIAALVTVLDWGAWWLLQ